MMKKVVTFGEIMLRLGAPDYLRLTQCQQLDMSFAGAEADLSRLEEVEYVITVDPIDGTENFISGLKEWGVGISVYKMMQHYQSMILLPELGICLCTGDKFSKITGSRICGLSSYMQPEDFTQLDLGDEYRIMGCCMYNMYNVIHGSYKQFLHLKGCYSWDILPGMNLALEHGLKVEIDGKKYNGEFLNLELSINLWLSLIQLASKNDV